MEQVVTGCPNPGRGPRQPDLVRGQTAHERVGTG